MGNIRMALGMLSVVAVLAGPLCGADLAAAQMAPSLGLQQISGKILLVDPKARLLKVEVEAEKAAGTVSTSHPMEFALAETTVITEGSRMLQPEDLRVGTKVQVEYTAAAEEGKHIAQSISVQAPGGGTRSPEGATAPQEREQRQSPPVQPFKPSR